MANPLVPFALRWLGNLRFPTLAVITAVVFVADLLIPDFVPFIDEIILGLLTLLFAAWKRRKPDPDDAASEVARTPDK